MGNLLDPSAFEGSTDAGYLRPQEGYRPVSEVYTVPDEVDGRWRYLMGGTEGLVVFLILFGAAFLLVLLWVRR